jgi:RhoGEF domain
LLGQWFRDELSKEECMPEEVLTLLFNHVDPIYEHHSFVLKEMEHRLAAWEGRANTFAKGDVQRVGDVLLKITSKLDVSLITSGDDVLYSL